MRSMQAGTNGLASRAASGTLVMLLLLSAVTIPKVAFAEDIFFISALSEGTRYDAAFDGIHRITVIGGAAEVCPQQSVPWRPDWWGWKTGVLGYKNREVEWGEGYWAPEHPNPSNWDFSLGDETLYRTYEEAEQSGTGMFVEVPLLEHDYIILVINDSRGHYFDNHGGILLSITVPPTASFTYAPHNPIAGEPVCLDASGSHDPDGEIATYTWDFGNGCTGSGKTVIHTYNKAGEYSVTLTVTDAEGQQDSCTMVVCAVPRPGMGVYLDKDEYSKGRWRLVCGAAADGESEVIILIPCAATAGEYSVTAEAGSIYDVRALPDGALLVYWRAPEGFGAFAPSEGWKEIHFYVEVNGQSITNMPPFYLLKPPVVLVHGIWSNAKALIPLRDHLSQEYSPLVRVIEYGNDLHFDENVPHVGRRLSSEINSLCHHGFPQEVVIKQVDIVAHSMGGVLTNLYVASDAYGSDVNRLITIGTPHSGSELANFALNFLYREMDTAARTCWAGLFGALGHSLTRGAVEDLQVGSLAMRQYREKCQAVPAYAVRCANSGCSPEMNLVYSLLYALDGKLDPSSTYFEGADLLYLSDAFGALYNHQKVEDGLFRTVCNQWPDDCDSDLIVSQASQRGGCLAGSDLVPEAGVIDHVTETNNPTVQAEVLRVLRSPLTIFDSTGFHPRADHPVPVLGAWESNTEQSEPTANLLPSIAEQGVGLAITSPSRGSIFRPGATVPVAVSYHGSAGGTAYCIANCGPLQVDTMAPYEWEFAVPADFAGPMTIAAWCWNGAGLPQADIIDVVVVPQEIPTSLRIIPTPPIYLTRHTEQKIRVLGEYPDRVVRDLSSSVTGTTYASSDPLVASVSSDGTVSALSSGQTTVTITNTLSVQISVFVDRKPMCRYVPVQYSTIQSAIDVASDGDEVVVLDGIYTGSGNQDINFRGKAITVRSQNGPENCIIDCQASESDPHRGFYFQGAETATSVVTGLTITNAYSPNGAGIRCDGASPTIEGNVISGNTAGSSGGGISVYFGSSPVIINNEITGNTAADHGGGIDSSQSSPTIVGNMITRNSSALYGGGIECRESTLILCQNGLSDNTAGRSGGAIACFAGSLPTILDNTIMANDALERNGGGIYCAEGSSLAMTHNMVIGNSAEREGGGISCRGGSPAIADNTFFNNMGRWGGGIYCGESGPVITNNVVAANSATDGGGGICSDDKATPTISGNTITGNAALNAGGGICCDDSAPVVDNNTVTNNTANLGGGIGCVNGAAPRIETNVISDNAASESGGGIFSYASAPMIRANTCELNTAAEGGGMFCNGSSGSIVGNTFTSNIADGCGGAIHCFDSSLTIAGNTISGNQTNVHSGAAIFCNESSPPITENTITANVSSQCGGAIACIAGSAPDIIDNEIIGNVAADQAGAIWCDASSPIVIGNVISANTATNEGGAISCVADARSMITGNTIIGNTTRRDGGGIHCYYSSPQVTGNCIADNSAQMDGGGIRCRQNCSAEISDNSIVGNEATDGNGGGIYCDSSSPTVGNNTISGNAANWDGGGIECGLNSAAVVVGNVITGNVAQHSGGGVCCWRDRSPTFARNQVVGNTAGWGGGGVTLWSQSSPTITNNTICGNRGNENGGGIYCDESTATVRNAILWGNSALSGPQIALRRNCTMSVLYSDVGGGEASVYVEAGCILNWGIGNIDDDPLFGDPGYWDDIGTPDDLSDDVWKDGDYHLKSRHGRWNPDANGGIGGWVIDDVTSPCIDTGDPASDFSQELMPNFARINMGAFGNTSEASKSGWPIPGDVNGDCSVNVLDLIWARNRLGQDVNTGDVWRADVNGDGRVNVLDLIAVRNRLGGKCQ